MHSNPPTPQLPAPIVAWIIWFSILSGLLVIQFVLGGGIPTGPNQGEASLLQRALPIAPALLALVVRFMVIPRIGDPAKKLPAMIIGLAFAEATGLLGIIFVSPSLSATRLTHFVVAVLTIIVMAPIYMNKRPDQDRYMR